MTLGKAFGVIKLDTGKNKLGDGKFDKKEIMISSWNVNGIRAFIKKPYFKEYMKKENPDIICFNETKINADTLHVL